MVSSAFMLDFNAQRQHTTVTFCLYTEVKCNSLCPVKMMYILLHLHQLDEYFYHTVQEMKTNINPESKKKKKKSMPAGTRDHLGIGIYILRPHS